MKVLVTGAQGQLGREMQLMARESCDEYIFTDIAELDITDRDAVCRMIDAEKVDLIVNCAAYTNVDQAEDDEARAELINAAAVENLAVAMKQRDGVLIHISTDYVFGGEQHNTPCDERQTTNPTGAYGRTKLHGEEAIRRSGVKHLVIRTAWLYSEFGKNFVKTMLHLTATRPELKVVFDQVGTPTYALDLARVIVHIISNRLYEGHEGVYHFSNEGVCSWYDFAKMIAEYGGHHQCRIIPCHSDEFPSKVRRPSYSVLDKTKLKNTFGVEIPFWIESLKMCIKNLQNEEF